MVEDWNPSFVIPVTYGRSGSTLLMGLLNSIDGYSIVGENNDSMKYLIDFYINMRDVVFNTNGKGVDDAWYNKCSLEHLKLVVRRCMASICDPSHSAKCVGWKEIRYIRHLGSDLGKFLSNLFFISDCRFVFLTRDLDDTCKSEWWARNPNCKKNLGSFEDFVFRYIEDNKSQDWFHLTYEDLCKGNVRSLFSFLGEDFDYESVKKVLAHPWGYKTDGKIKVSKI